MSEHLLDAAGRRRSPATMPGFHAGRPPRNKGMRYPADPPTVEEIVAVMRAAGETIHGQRLRGLIVVLWRAGLRISEALALAEPDLDPRRGAVLVRRGKGGRRREVGMDDWAWEQLQPWLTAGSSCRSGRCSASSPARRAAGAGRSRPLAAQLRDTAAAAGVRRRFAPHQLRHAHAVELAHEGVPLVVIQRSSATATSASRPCTCRASTTPRSSRPCTPGARRWSPSAPTLTASGPPDIAQSSSGSPGAEHPSSASEVARRATCENDGRQGTTVWIARRVARWPR